MSDQPLNALITMVSAAFGGTSGAVGESGKIFSGISQAYNTFYSGDTQDDSQPGAYLNYILLDRQYKVLDMGWQKAPAANFTKQNISFNTLEISEPGILYVYLSYEDESSNWLYFDDLNIQHTKSNIIQYNDYYPFGLQTSSSWTREENINNFLYNAAMS